MYATSEIPAAVYYCLTLTVLGVWRHKRWKWCLTMEVAATTLARPRWRHCHGMAWRQRCCSCCGYPDFMSVLYICHKTQHDMSWHSHSAYISVKRTRVRSRQTPTWRQTHTAHTHTHTTRGTAIQRMPFIALSVIHIFYAFCFFVLLLLALSACVAHISLFPSGGVCCVLYTYFVMLTDSV